MGHAGHFACSPSIPQLHCLTPALLHSLCGDLVFRGVIWSSSSRYGGGPAGAQHPPGHSEAQLPVEAGHEHLTGCPGAAGWACQGKGTTSKRFTTECVTVWQSTIIISLVPVNKCPHRGQHGWWFQVSSSQLLSQKVHPKGVALELSARHHKVPEWETFLDAACNFSACRTP